MQIRAEIEVPLNAVAKLRALGFRVGSVLLSEYHDEIYDVQVLCDDKEYPNLLKSAGVFSGITSMV